MIKKWILLSLVVCSLHAQEASEGSTCPCFPQILIEAKGAYFLPSNDLFRKIYGNGGGIYGLEASIQSWRELYTWVSADVFTKTGKSLGASDKTRMTFVPLGLGLKYLYSFRHFGIYAGAGISGTYLQIHDQSDFAIESISKWGVGGIGKAGLLWRMTHYLFLDFFAQYSYTKINFHNTHGGFVIRTDANISGWSFGGAIGGSF